MSYFVARFAELNSTIESFLNKHNKLFLKL